MVFNDEAEIGDEVWLLPPPSGAITPVLLAVPAPVNAKDVAYLIKYGEVGTYNLIAKFVSVTTFEVTISS